MVSASVTCVMVLSLRKERAEVRLESKGKNPNSVTDTQHDTTCAATRGVFHTDVTVTTHKKG